MTDEKQSAKQESGSQQPKQPQSSHQQDQKPGQGAEHDPKNKDPQKSQRGSSEGAFQDRNQERLDPTKDRKAS